MLPLLPEREQKPRPYGVTMVMDKGLGIRQARDLVETSGHLIDFLKLGFGTSMVTKNTQEKVALYRDYDMKVYVGGTLFEAFLIRDRLDDYLRFIDQLGCDTIEISDGSILIEAERKCALIEKLSKKYTVLSEVGAKDSEVMCDTEHWIKSMEDELSAGSSYVIGEARESGTVGIYEKNGSANDHLIQTIIGKIPTMRIIWEAPLKSQQAWFIRLLGPNVNLGNIAPSEIAALETLRLGLRGDTFFDFLPDEMNKFNRLTK